MRAHIYKYELGITGDVQSLSLPANFHLCDINAQGETICLWALVNLDEMCEIVRFKIYGTGWEINDIKNLYYLKTVHMPNGLVWHVFCINEEALKEVKTKLTEQNK